MLALLAATVGLTDLGSSTEAGAGPAVASPRDEAPTDTATANGVGSFNALYESTPITANGDYQPLIGNFDCEAGGGAERDIIWYAPGPAPDYLWRTSGVTGGELQYTSTPLTINGTYEPFIVNYDNTGGCYSDVFWYAPGPAPDYIWDVDTPGGFGYTSVPQTVNGDYTPMTTSMGDFGTPPLDTGVFWYAPGTTPDYLWRLDNQGGITKGTGPQVTGTYRPVRATDLDLPLGTSGFLWYAPGTAQDHYWDPCTAVAPPTNDCSLELGDTAPAHDIPVTINGTYQPHALGDAGKQVLLYGPGPAPDHLIIEIDRDTGALTTIPGTVNGVYRVATSAEMIVWHAPGAARDHVWIQS